MSTIVLCYPVNEKQVAEIQAASGGMNVIVSDQDTIGREIFQADIYCGHARKGLPWEEIVQAGRLKWIQSSAAGLDHCLAPSVVHSEIVVSGASGLFARQVAEHTVSLLLAVLRRIPAFLRARSQGKYERLPTDDLRGKRVGIAGFGLNGQQIARLLRPFETSILAIDLFPEHKPAEFDFSVLPATRLNHLFEVSDIVVAVLPLTAATQEVIGESEFQAMRPGSYFVNVGRGQTVDECALIRALQSKRLQGAALDVCAFEPPLAESPLWNIDNLLLTPHVGAQGATRYDDVTRLFVENLKRWRTGATLRNLVDKQLGFPHPKDRISW